MCAHHACACERETRTLPPLLLIGRNVLAYYAIAIVQLGRRAVKADQLVALTKRFRKQFSTDPELMRPFSVYDALAASAAWPKTRCFRVSIIYKTTAATTTTRNSRLFAYERASKCALRTHTSRRKDPVNQASSSGAFRVFMFAPLRPPPPTCHTAHRAHTQRDG